MTDQEIDIPIVGGIDEKTDSRLAVKPTSILNARYAKSGALAKRFGYDIAGAYNARLFGGSPPTPYLLESFGNELLRIGGGELDSHKVTGLTDWVYKDRVANVKPRRSGLSSEPGQILDVDCAIHNGVMYAAYVSVQADGTHLSARYYILVDVIVVETGVRIYAKYPVAAASTLVGNPKVVIINSVPHVFWRTTTEIKYRTINATNFNVSAAFTLLSSLKSEGDIRAMRYDVAALSPQGNGNAGVVAFVVIFENGSGVNRLQVAPYDAGYATVGSSLIFGDSTVAGYTDFRSMAVIANSADHIVAVASNTAGGDDEVYLSTWTLNGANTSIGGKTDSTLVSVTTPKPWFRVYACNVGANRSLIGWSYAHVGSNAGPMQWNEFDNAGARLLSPTDRGLLDAVAISEPFQADNGRTYQLVQGKDEGAGTYFLIDLRQGDATGVASMFLVASVAVEQVSSDSFPRGYSVSNVARAGTGAYRIGIVTSASTPKQTVAEILSLTIGDPPMSVTALPKLLVIGGGILTGYDTSETFELGFAHSPTNLSIAETTGGSKTALGTYAVRVIYEKTDAAGNIYRSAPSEAEVITLTGSNDAIAVTVDNVQLTNFLNETDEFLGKVSAVAYCTVAGGNAFHRDTDYLIPRDNFLGDPLEFDLLASDSDLLEREFLYSTGGEGEELVNRMPPAASFQRVYQGSLVLGGTEDNRFWISKPLVPGEGPGFNGLIASDPFEYGEVTGIATQDGILFAFTSDGVYETSGEVPDARGLGGTLFSWQRLPSLVGCTDHRSIRETPLGITFRGRDGLYLITRSREVVPLDKSVEDSATFGYCAVSYIPAQDTLRFAADGGNYFYNLDLYQSSGGDWVWTRDLVWDWGTQTVDPAEQVTPNGVIVSACYHAGVFFWISSTGMLYRESTTTWKDTAGSGTGRWITLDVKTGWLRVAGIQGYTRCRKVGVLGRRGSAAGLTVDLYLDYDEYGTPQTRAYSATAITAATLHQVQMSPHPQQCEAFQLRVRDAAPGSGAGFPDLSANTGQGIGITGVRATVDIMGGQRRLPKSLTQ